MEKPKRVEIGQRWQSPFSKRTRVVARVYGESTEAFWLSDEDGSDEAWCHASYLLETYDYLGPSTPKTVPWEVGQRRRGKLYANANMEGAVVYDGEYIVGNPRDVDSVFQWRVEVPGDYWFACESWPSELLPAAPSTEGAPEEVWQASISEGSPWFDATRENAMKYMFYRKKPKGASPGSAREPKPLCERVSSGGATHAAVGNMTALQLIQSRKPPEPYICPVDDWDLLRDA
jgi:hypothetical protein